jgi:alpha-L-fucosidase 2
MPDLTRRQAMRLGAALVPLVWTATARTGSAAPAAVRAVNDLALWYDKPAGTEWLRALPIGNGRLGAMVFGNTDTERLQLNEDTVWAGGPHDYSNPQGAGALAQVRQLVFANQWTQAQSLIDQKMLGNPAAQQPYQPVGTLSLALPGGSASSYQRWLDLTTATTVVTYVANNVRYRREVFASAADQVIVVRLTAETRSPWTGSPRTAAGSPVRSGSSHWSTPSPRAGAPPVPAARCGSPGPTRSPCWSRSAPVTSTTAR